MVSWLWTTWVKAVTCEWCGHRNNTLWAESLPYFSPTGTNMAFSQLLTPSLGHRCSDTVPIGPDPLFIPNSFHLGQQLSFQEETRPFGALGKVVLGHAGYSSVCKYNLPHSNSDDPLPASQSSNRPLHLWSPHLWKRDSNTLFVSLPFSLFLLAKIKSSFCLWYLILQLSEEWLLGKSLCCMISLWPHYVCTHLYHRTQNISCHGQDARISCKTEFLRGWGQDCILFIF